MNQTASELVDELIKLVKRREYSEGTQRDLVSQQIGYIAAEIVARCEK